MAAEQLRALDYQVEYHRISEYDTAIENGIEAIGIVKQWIYDAERAKRGWRSET